jgi:hypothetical protein
MWLSFVIKNIKTYDIATFHTTIPYNNKRQGFCHQTVDLSTMGKGLFISSDHWFRNYFVSILKLK